MSEYDLLIAQDLDHLLEMLAENPDARMVAGATDFIPLVGAGKWKPRLAIDITRVEALRGCSNTGGWISLGALTTHGEGEVSPSVILHGRALTQACASVADPLIRRRATLGGNLCTASPAADSVPALLALDAEVKLDRLGHTRRIALDDFLLGPGKTAIQPGEVLSQIFFPDRGPNDCGSAFVKLGKRRAMAISVVNAAASVVLVDGRIQQVRLALGSVAPRVVRCRTAERLLVGMSREEVCARDGGTSRWAASVDQDISPIDDIRASAAYRRSAAAVLAQRVVEEAFNWALQKVEKIS